ncbi:bile acid:sodium symporter [Thiocapsa sp.]|uniref:bile acid:sodium symporter family protein n=1 Tax=Thiocapsa sp. TaxID=2024551 RepID=UPI001BCC6B24|nr:bile acid:sodium symporter [Thiocapsa sp.]
MDIAIPALVWLLMLVVGLELTPGDFRRVLVYPRAVAIATLGQLLLLPACAALLIWAARPEPWIVSGMILLAASPGGAISNLYSYLGRGNVALSVTLTALSTLLALVTMPTLTAAGLVLFLQESHRLVIPAGRMIVQLSLMMLLPLTLGMALRAWRPAGVAAVRQPLRLLSLVGLACLVSLILIDQHEGLPAAVRAALPTALPFCIITMAAGFIVGSLVRLPSEDRFTLLIEFSTRNLGLVAIMGALIMGQVKLVLFATLVFLIELPLVLVLIAMRSRLAGDRNKTPA